MGRTDLKQDGRTAELREHGWQGDGGKKWPQCCTNTQKHKPVLHNITPSYCITRL